MISCESLVPKVPFEIQHKIRCWELLLQTWIFVTIVPEWQFTFSSASVYFQSVGVYLWANFNKTQVMRCTIVYTCYKNYGDVFFEVFYMKNGKVHFSKLFQKTLGEIMYWERLSNRRWLKLSYKSEKHLICFNSINHLRNKVVNRFDLCFLKNFVRLCFSFMFSLRQVKWIKNAWPHLQNWVACSLRLLR